MPIINGRRVRLLHHWTAAGRELAAAPPAQPNARRVWASDASGFGPWESIEWEQTAPFTATTGTLRWRTPPGGQADPDEIYPEVLIQFTQGDIVNWLRFDLTRHQPTQRIQAADGRFYEVYEYRYTTPGFTSHIGWQNFGDASVPIAINLWVPLDSWFRPEERWLVDWDGDGSFDHAQSDVTSQVVDYDYEFGLQPQEDLRDLPLAAAQGSLRLLNLDGRYTPADAHELSSELETGRYLVRHQVSSPSASPFLDLDSPHTIWEGWLDAPKLERRGATDYAVFPLTGKSEAALDTEIDLFVGQANQMQVFREMASAAGATVGTRNNGPAHPQIHQAALTGLLRERLQDLARYAFGWVFEDAAGALNFRSGFDLAAQQPSGRTRFTPGVAANDIDVLVVADGTFGQRDAAGVRNRLERTTNVLVEQPTQTLYQSGMPGGQVAPGFEGIRQSDGRRRQWLGNAEIRVTDIDPLGVRFDQASISAAWTYQDARGTRVSIPNGMTRSAAVGHSSDISPFDTLTVEASVPLRPVIPLYFLGVTVTGGTTGRRGWSTAWWASRWRRRISGCGCTRTTRRGWAAIRRCTCEGCGRYRSRAGGRTCGCRRCSDRQA